MLERVFYIFVGAVITWLFQQYRTARSEEAALISEHVKDIEKLSEAISEYWLKPTSTDIEEQAAAAKVRSRLAALSLIYPDIARICGGSKGDQYKKLSLELFKVGLGGEFESRQGKANPEIAIDAYQCSARLIHHLRMVKSDLASLGRLISSVTESGATGYKALLSFLMLR